jgi:hypothetical protein
MGNRRNIESQSPAAPDADPELDGLFAQARNHLPADETLLRVLRAVPSSRRGAAHRLLKPLAAALSAAAVIVAAVLIYLPPGQHRAFALADVAREMRNVPALKATSADGTIQYSGHGRFAEVREGGRRVWFWDEPARVRATYDADRGTVILSSADPWPPLGDGGVAYLTLDRLVQEAEAMGRSLEDDWIRADTTEGDRKLVILTAKSQPRRARFSSCGIDAATGRFAWVDYAGERTTYAYPSEAPCDIYALGVPREVPVVDWRAGPELAELRNTFVAGEEAMDRQYVPYRMVEVDTTFGTDEVTVTITDGRRYRAAQFPVASQDHWTPGELAALASTYAKAGASMTAEHTTVCDGEKETVLYPATKDQAARRWTERHVEDSRLHPLNWLTWRRATGVFFGPFSDQRFERLEPNEHGWLGFRSFEQPDSFSLPRAEDVWVDPAHGFLPCRFVGTVDPSADWVVQPNWQDKYVRDLARRKSPILHPLPDARPERTVTEIVAWGEVRPGQWYPQVIRTTTLIRADDGTWQEGTQDQFETGYIAWGEIQRHEQPQDTRRFGSSSTYRYVLVEPIDQVDETWFQVPPEWSNVPAEPG